MLELWRRFQKFFYDVVLKHEGGLSNHPNDTGGLTKFGIASRVWGDKVDVKTITPYVACLIYFVEYFLATFIYDVWQEKKNWKLVTKLVDMNINLGLKATENIYRKIIDMGITDTNTIIELLVSEQKAYYQRIVEKNPSQQVFLKGWLKRAEFRGVDS